MAKVHVCEAPRCTNTFIPKAGAKRALYCSQKCNQRAYNARLKAKREAQSRTLDMEEAIFFNAMSEAVPALESAIDRYEKTYGSPATMGTIKLIAGIAQALGMKSS